MGKILRRYRGRRSALIAILLDTQAEFGYLPAEALKLIAERTDFSLDRICSIATFFNAFSLKPKGKYPIRVCMGTACQIKGAQMLSEKFERELRIKEGDTTDDGIFSLHKVYCLGCCGLAPVVMVGDEVHGKLTLTKVPVVLRRYKSA